MRGLTSYYCMSNVFILRFIDAFLLEEARGGRSSCCILTVSIVFQMYSDWRTKKGWDNDLSL